MHGLAKRHLCTEPSLDVLGRGQWGALGRDRAGGKGHEGRHQESGILQKAGDTRAGLVGQWTGATDVGGGAFLASCPLLLLPILHPRT